ncbi:uncharacterized protein Z518_09275 [Rhinocladiella mackenziei CBS 650.93]|uniref:Uncharacterized protein n=1 Tax=Rhinocladiella mackenziei CBS 650.93 TaxID=1442369 RepID=A0A0D2I6W7_9EURO|nr:uncharacterized protein Z518_09275 [Rhinocladiella mackenziei CBS 650.93]KIX01549.1 hypothetical protein Z518_09275 [Rhinocladiella mackenziei CBS 650.93]
MAPYATATAPEWLPANQHRSNLFGKRKADDELESQSNISSYFKKLRLNHAIPHPAVPSSQPASPSPSTNVAFRPHIANTDARPALSVHSDRHEPPSPHKVPSMAGSDFMTVDDTPHRIIINNLDAEIAQIEAEEVAASSTVFLPDIDKKVSTIPYQLLQDGEQASVPENLNTALVLYKDPSSISVPEEEDVVRKTIIAARARAREKQAEEQRERERQEALRREMSREDGVELSDAMTDHSSHGDDDLDPMEIE